MAYLFTIDNHKNHENDFQDENESEKESVLEGGT